MDLMFSKFSMLYLTWATPLRMFPTTSPYQMANSGASSITIDLSFMISVSFSQSYS